MKVEGAVTAASGAFIGLSAIVYWVMGGEEAGVVMLALAAAALLSVGAWIARAGRRHGPRPCDRDGANPAGGDGAGEVGYFPASSIWPFLLACGAVVAANGLAFGVWLAVTGALLVVTAIVGYAVEASSRA